MSIIYTSSSQTAGLTTALSRNRLLCQNQSAQPAALTMPEACLFNTMEPKSYHAYEYEPSPYDFACDTEFFDPSKSPHWNKAGNKLEIALHLDNLNPRGGKSWSDAIKRVHEINASGGQAKIVFAMRHCQTVHNDAQTLCGNGPYSLMIAQSPAFHDSRLSELGQTQAEESGKILHAAIRAGAPMPRLFYSSSQRRCSQTAALMLDACGKLGLETDGTDTQVTLAVTDLCREWLGVNHKHAADQRASKTELAQMIMEELKFKGDLEFLPGFAEDDPEFDFSCGRTDLVEARIEVAQRIRVLLGKIFEGPDLSYGIIFHSGAHVCLARALGYPAEELALHMANGAIVAYLVIARRLDLGQVEARTQMEEVIRSAEVAKFTEELQNLHEEAKDTIRTMDAVAFQTFRGTVASLVSRRRLEELESYRTNGSS